MIKNVKATAAVKHGVRPADRKQVELFSKNGIASNRQGICYGSRTPEHDNQQGKQGMNRKKRARQEQRTAKG